MPLRQACVIPDKTLSHSFSPPIKSMTPPPRIFTGSFWRYAPYFLMQASENKEYKKQTLTILPPPPTTKIV